MVVSRSTFANEGLGGLSSETEVDCVNYRVLTVCRGLSAEDRVGVSLMQAVRAEKKKQAVAEKAS